MMARRAKFPLPSRPACGQNGSREQIRKNPVTNEDET